MNIDDLEVEINYAEMRFRTARFRGDFDAANKWISVKNDLLAEKALFLLAKLSGNTYRCRCALEIYKEKSECER